MQLAMVGSAESSRMAKVESSRASGSKMSIQFWRARSMLLPWCSLLANVLIWASQTAWCSLSMLQGRLPIIYLQKRCSFLIMDPDFMRCLHESIFQQQGWGNGWYSLQFYLIFFVYAINKLICCFVCRINARLSEWIPIFTQCVHEMISQHLSWLVYVTSVHFSWDQPRALC